MFISPINYEKGKTQKLNFEMKKFLTSLLAIKKLSSQYKYIRKKLLQKVLSACVITSLCLLSCSAFLSDSCENCYHQFGATFNTTRRETFKI